MLLLRSARNTTPATSSRSLGRTAGLAGLLAAAMILSGGSAAQAAFTAYNDCVYDASVPSGTDPNGQTVHYTTSDVTTWGIGDVAADYTGTAYAPPGSSGTPTGVTATFSQNVAAAVIWQPQVAATWTGGYDTALGTDARNTFGGIADMTGTSYYGASGWYVDITLSGLDPSKLYTFATSASRARANTDGSGTGYDYRITIYTLSGANASTNSSSVGVTQITPTSVSYSTGNNHAAGYVARWSDIDPGADGSIVIRAEADLSTGPAGNEHKAYAFDVFQLEEQAECGNSIVEGGEECDDGNTADGDCCSSTCSFESNGSVCDNGNACSVLDTCDGAGICVAGGPLGCDDSNSCTDDSCNPAAGCEYVNNTDPCDNGDACTAGDVCGGGACTSGGPLDCDDANGCTDDSCDSGLGCQYVNNTDLCDNGDACTVGDTCGGGSCQAGGPLDCDDTNGCTDDSCDSGLGCQYVNNTDLCDNGDACTSDDSCGGGSCQAGGPTDCDDGDECTADSCDQVLGCAHDPIPLCGSAVPSASPAGRMLVGLLLMSAGAVFLGQRRRQRS